MQLHDESLTVAIMTVYIFLNVVVLVYTRHGQFLSHCNYVPYI